MGLCMRFCLFQKISGLCIGGRSENATKMYQHFKLMDSGKFNVLYNRSHGFLYENVLDVAFDLDKNSG